MKKAIIPLFAVMLLAGCGNNSTSMSNSTNAPESSGYATNSSSVNETNDTNSVGMDTNNPAITNGMDTNNPTSTNSNQ